MANIQVGKYLYNREEMPMLAKVLKVLASHKNGWPTIKIAETPEILALYGHDSGRALQRVNVALSNLRFRKVVSAVSQNSNDYWQIVAKDEAKEIVEKGLEIAKVIQAKCANVPEVKVISEDSEVSVKSNKTKKVSTMSNTPAKTAKLFLNPETNKVEPFGAGRPSKLKLAFACNAEGKYLNPQLAASFVQNGGKSDDKLTKDELVRLVAQLRAKNDELTAKVNDLTVENSAMRETLESMLPDEDSEDAETDEDSNSEDNEAE